MTDRSKITVTSKRSLEFSSNITIDDVTYHVQTEDMGKKYSKIITSIFLKGEIIAAVKSDYGHLLKLKDGEARIAVLMEKHHKSVIDNFVAEQSKSQKQKPDYFAEVQQLLRRGNGKQAIQALRDGLARYPNDPFLLSYYGCLVAVVEGNAREGIKICEGALRQLKASLPFGSEFFYPVFHLNLGRAYLQADRKTDAIRAFQQGLKNDPDHGEILWELRKLGSRRKPLVPFLKRENPINKYIGMLLGKTTK